MTVEVTRIQIPVDPVPQKFVYTIGLGETKACFLRELLKQHIFSNTACSIVAGLKKAGLE